LTTSNFIALDIKQVAKLLDQSKEGKLKKIVKALKANWLQIGLNSIAASMLLPSRLRARVYRLLGVDIQTSLVGPRCFLGGTDIHVGRGSFLNVECFLDTSAHIHIGINCSIGMQTMLVTSTHEIGTAGFRALQTFGKPISIGDGCWLGARTTVLPGITIGNGCVIGAGSLVTRDCEANGLYVGSPARRIRDLG
jgi:maltose O-acetyltransferase